MDDPILPIVGFGFVGGLVFAACIIWAGRRGRRDTVVVPDRGVISAPVINIASIRVEGVGGLGLVVACLGVAIAIPAIGSSLLTAAMLGVVCAALLVTLRRTRKGGPLPSSGARPGASTTLAIDAPEGNQPATPADGPPPALTLVGRRRGLSSLAST